MLNAINKRVRLSGLPALAEAVALREVLENVIDAGVDVCRSEAWAASWAEVGEATNMTRQSAQERWGSLGGARKPGGQPSSLR